MCNKFPDNWNISFLSNKCNLSGGYGFPDKLQGEQSSELPFIKVSDMNLPSNEKYITCANNHVSFLIADKMHWRPFPANTIVFAKVGAALKLNRRRILTEPTLIDNNMMAAVPFPGTEPSFLYHFLTTIDFGNFVQDGALPSINQTQVGCIKIPEIEIGEQRAIAEVLDTFDETIRQTETIIAKLRQVKAAMLHDILTRGLDENGELRDPAQHPEQFKESPLGWIPKKWRVKGLFDVATIVEGQVDPQITPFIDCPLVAPNHIESETGRLLSLKSARDQGAISGKYYFYANDVIYCKIRPYLRKVWISTIEGLCSADMYPFRSGIEIDPFFLYLILSSERFTNYAISVSERSGFPKINRTELSGFQVTLPSQDEQKEIANVIKSIEKKIESEEIYKLKSLKFKDGLMHDLLTGKVRVPEKLREAMV